MAVDAESRRCPTAPTLGGAPTRLGIDGGRTEMLVYGDGGMLLLPRGKTAADVLRDGEPDALAVPAIRLAINDIKIVDATAHLAARGQLGAQASKLVQSAIVIDRLPVASAQAQCSSDGLGVDLRFASAQGAAMTFSWRAVARDAVESVGPLQCRYPPASCAKVGFPVGVNVSATAANIRLKRGAFKYAIRFTPPAGNVYLPNSFLLVDGFMTFSHAARWLVNHTSTLIDGGTVTQALGIAMRTIDGAAEFRADFPTIAKLGSVVGAFRKFIHFIPFH